MWEIIEGEGWIGDEKGGFEAMLWLPWGAGLCEVQYLEVMVLHFN